MTTKEWVENYLAGMKNFGNARCIELLETMLKDKNMPTGSSTVRDEFAMAALQFAGNVYGLQDSDIAEWSYRMADAMLKARYK